MIERVRDLPVLDSPEDSLRGLVPGDFRGYQRSQTKTFRHVYDFLEKERDVEAVIGYSEGSGLGASIMIDEQKRLLAEGRPKMIKCGIFFTGWPPISEEGTIILADESESYVQGHTIHVIGANGE